MNPIGRLLAFAGRRHWALVAAAALLVVALVLPPVAIPRDTFDYLVTIDITQSMNTEDVVLGGAPVSRLAFAKASLREALTHLPCGSRIGWSVFTGQHTLLLLPPIEVCRNFDALIASLDGIDGRMRWTNWSRIAEGGVYFALRLAHELGHGTRVAFVTDGQEAPPVSANALDRGIAVPGIGGWLIGVGGDAPVPIPKTDANGNRRGYWGASEVIQIPPAERVPPGSESHEERSALRGHYLARLAGRVGLGYRRLLGPDSLVAALRDPRLVHRVPVPTDVRWVPALAALVLLVWRYLPPRFARRSRANAIREFFPAASVASESRNGLP